jgi:hypothetical protein
LKTPLSLVTVWVVESLFIQVIVVPALTGRVAGENVKFASEMVLPETTGEEVTVDAAEQADRTKTTSRTRITGTK